MQQCIQRGLHILQSCMVCSAGRETLTDSLEQTKGEEGWYAKVGLAINHLAINRLLGQPPHKGSTCLPP